MALKTKEQLQEELNTLRERFRESESRRQEAEETLNAIRNGEVDALVVKGPEGDQIFTLKNADQPYRIMVEQMQEGAATLNPDGTLLYCNQRLARMLKTPLKALIGGTLYDWVAAENRQTLQSLLWDGMNGIAHREAELRAQDDSFVPVLLSVNSLPSDELSALCMVITDLTEQKRNAQIMAEERLTRSILDQATEAIVVCDREGRVIRASEEARRLCGGDPIRRTFEEAFPLLCENHHCVARNWSKECRNRAAAMTGQAARAIEAKLTRHDGRELDVLVSVGPLWGEPHEPIGCIISMTDVGNRKQAEEALAAAKLAAEQAKAAAEQAKAAAEEASRAKDHFLAVLSHELRTPLTAVLPSLGALEPLVPDAGREYITMARRNVELEARLIDDLLDVTRIARGKVELERRPIELGEIIHRAAQVCAADIEARRLHFGIQIDGGPQLVDGDPARLQQVFWNLIKNAVKFTPPGGCVGVRAFPQNGRAIVEVTDSGVGIEPEAMDRIFNAFEQAERSITRQFGGLGLGLAISKALVELHGGTIAAHSEGRGEGATFTVQLPLLTRAESKVLSAESGGDSALSTQNSALSRPLRILLVEDHGDTARILSRLLTAEGHEVVRAGDVATALEIAAAGEFDVLVSDLGLPDASGHDLMRHLVSRGQHLNAIALSGYGMAADVQKSREVGFAEHITKPVNFEVLREAISRVAGLSVSRP